MAPGKKDKKVAKPKKFHVDLNAANWPDFTGDAELQGFLDSHVTGKVRGKAKQGGWKSVDVKISLEPKGGSSATTSKTEVGFISICKRPPC